MSTVASASVTSESPLAERLARRWETLPGLRGVLSTVDHKEIGVRYLVTALGSDGR